MLFKLRANNAVHRAVKRGTLTRPASCSSCHVACKPHGHHHLGYDPKNWLNVVWLCVACHEAEHHPAS